MGLLAIIVPLMANKIPIYFGPDSAFIGWDEFFRTSLWLPIIFIIIIVFDVVFYLYLRKWIFKGSMQLSIRITRIESIEYEPLSFLASYLIPLVSFNMTDQWHSIVLLILFAAIGVIYVKGDMYYMNPTLSLLGFRIYIIDALSQNGTSYEKIVIITRQRIGLNKNIKYIELSRNVFYAEIFEVNDKGRITN